MADRMGQQLGNYRLISLLGQGGFAEVYLGEHMYLGTRAAIKVLHTRLANEDLESFRNEARTIAHLIHPNIVRILEFGVEASVPFLVMDYAPNGTLRRRHPRGTKLSINNILPYVKQITAGLQYAHHEKLIHRDIKPENMLLGRNNEVVLSDFGIALIAQSSRLQSMQEVVGTVSYMAPEQFQGKPRLASDQYALGIVVYEWLSGDRPFHGSFTEIASQHMFVPPPPLREKVGTILPYVEEVVLKALAKDPKQRFASVQDFANALEQASLATFVHPPVAPVPLPGERNLPPVAAPASEPFVANATPPYLPTEPVSTSSSTSYPPTSPSLSTPSYKEVPGIYRQPSPVQSGQLAGFTQITQARKRPNFALTIGISLLLVVLIGSGIFFFTRTPGSNTGSLGANSGNTSGSGNGGTTGIPVGGRGCKKIGVLLPETATSARWDAIDRPLLEQDIPQMLPGATVDYMNAGGDSATQQNQAQKDLMNGDCILVIAATDTQKAAAIVASAKAQGVPVIAYDRLIYSNDLNYYVSFDLVKVGQLQGQYIVNHYKNYVTGAGHNNVAMINGAQTDNNAILFRMGALKALQPLYDNGTLKKVYDQYTPGWDNPTAQTEMEGVLTANQNNIQIAYVANDGMANSVIAVLKTQHLNGKVLVTGQDATVAGLQNIITGDQAMTVYKPLSKEAMATANLIAAISNGTDTSSLTNGVTTATSDGGKIPSLLETPVAVDKSNIRSTVVADNYVTLAEICQGLPSGAGGICP